MALINRIYGFVYSFVRKTPSRDMAHEMAAMFVALMVVMHVVGLRMVVGLIREDSHIFSGTAKTVLVVTTILLFAASLFYYVGRRNGVRVVNDFGNSIESRLSAVVGAGIFIETLTLPLLIAAFVVIRS